jgi:short-subunit dehydrogenase
MPDHTSGCTVLITGASSGIGRETALLYARRGARLVLASRSRVDLERVARSCTEAGAEGVLVHPTDISHEDQVQALVSAATERFGEVDIAVQCASVTVFGRFDEVPADVFDAVVRTNLCGSANLARAVLRPFRHRGRGQLVLVGSLLGQAAMPYQSAYIASKFALNGLVRLLRQENRDLRGVGVHGVYPGPVDTPIYDNGANYHGSAARPLPPTYNPARIAASIVRATDRGRSSEHNVNWVSAPLLAAYRLMPAAFDTMIGPFIRRAGFSRRTVPPSTGNVFEPASGGAG